jgi:hypothetical protein
MSIGDVMVRENYHGTKIVNVSLPGSMPSQYVKNGRGGIILMKNIHVFKREGKREKYFAGT